MLRKFPSLIKTVPVIKTTYKSNCHLKRVFTLVKAYYVKFAILPLC